MTIEMPSPAAGAAAPPPIPPELAELADDSARREVTASGPGTPDESLARLARRGDLLTRTAVARNRATAAYLLAELSTDPADSVRITVAGNPATPVDVLYQLLEDTNAVRRSVAGNPTTPVDALARLATDRSTLTRCAVAAHESTPGDVLMMLATDARTMTRAAVAANGNAPVEVLVRLAGDPGPAVLENVAGNPATPDDVVLNLPAHLIPEARWERLLAGLPEAARDVALTLVADGVQVSARQVIGAALTLLTSPRAIRMPGPLDPAR